MRQMRVLLWKEWRQMRGLLAACAIGGIALLALGRLWDAAQHSHLMDGTNSLAVLFCGFVAALLPATAIAGERKSGGLTFLMRLPLVGRRILLAKVLVLLAFLVILFAMAAGARAVLVWRSPLAGLGVPAGGAGLLALVMCTCLLLSAGTRRPALGFLLGLVAASVLFLLLQILLPARLIRYLPQQGEILGTRFVAWLAVYGVMCAWLVAAAGRALARAKGEARGAWRSAWPLLVPTGALLITHVAWFVARGLLFSPASAEILSPPIPSPDGARIAFTVRAGHYQDCMTRLCVLDVASGRTHLVTRFNFSQAIRSFGGGNWSPDSRYLLSGGFKDWYWPSWVYSPLPTWLPQEGRRWLERFGPRQWAALVDVPRFVQGRPRGESFHPLPAQPFGCWLGPDEVMVSGHVERRHVLWRCDLRQGKRWSAPVRVEGWPLWTAWPPALVRERGREGFTIQVFLPAEDAWHEYLVPQGSTLLDISPDGRHLLLFRGSATTEALPSGGDTPSEFQRGQLVLLAMPEDTLLTIAEPIYLLEPSGDPPPRPHAFGRGHSFSPDGRSVLYRVLAGDGQGDWLYQLDTAAPMKLPTFPGQEWAMPVFSPRGGRIAWISHWGRGREGYVFDIQSGVLNTLRLGEVIDDPNLQWLGEDHLVFVSRAVLGAAGPGGACRYALYRVRWDGTHIEQVFPQPSPRREGHT